MRNPWCGAASFADFEAFAASVPGCSIAAAPLRSGAFSSATTVFRLGDVVLQTGRSTPLMTTGGVDPGAACIALPLGRAGTLRLSGRAVGPGDVALYAPGAGHDGAIAHDTRWALVTLPAPASDVLLAP